MSSAESEAQRLRRRCQVECGARCCRYITHIMRAPRRKCDFDEIAWFLAHEHVSVYVEARRWHLEVRTPCRYLTPENLCANYDQRPQVCRDYSQEFCEFPRRPRHSLHFDTKEEFDLWMEKRRKARRSRKKAAKR